MEKYISKYISVLLSLIILLSFSLSGCGKKRDDNRTKQTQKVTKTTSKEEKDKKQSSKVDVSADDYPYFKKEKESTTKAQKSSLTKSSESTTSASHSNDNIQSANVDKSHIKDVPNDPKPEHSNPPINNDIVYDTEESVKVDFTYKDKGYLLVTKLKNTYDYFAVITKDLNTPSYDGLYLDTVGKTEKIPLTVGNKMMIFLTELIKESPTSDVYQYNNIGIMKSFTYNVSTSDEIKLYTTPNIYCDYSSNSALVNKAKQLCSDCTTDTEKINAIYNYVCSNLTYDNNMANNNSKKYIPDPDTVYKEKSCICTGFSSLMAAMLRSQNIPIKIVVGTEPSGNGHAWICVYSNDSGVIKDSKGNGTLSIIKGWNYMDPTTKSYFNRDFYSYVADYYF